MHVQALYHHQKREFGDESQFRQRIGVDAYKSQFNKTEDIPVIWRHIAYALPDKCYDIKTLWFNDYPIHQQDFTIWWTQTESNLSWSWDNGQFKTYGNELQLRHQEKHDNARFFINQAPESLRSNIINLYGKWSLSLLMEHFSDFLDYCKQDPEYAQLAWIHLSPTHQRTTGGCSNMVSILSMKTV
jgi:hypothetical protein